MAIYMKYGDVKGAVTHDGYDEWIECHSFQFGIGRGIHTPVGSGADREASNPSVSEVTLTKELDKATKDLLEASLRGDGVEVEIAFVSTGNPSSEILKYTLEDVLISSYSQSSGGDRPSESLSLNFTKFTVLFTELERTNKTGSPIRTGYDLSKATVL